MIGKKAESNEMFMMIIRILIVTVIAGVILIFSAFVYGYYINVRAVEAGILAKSVVNCFAPEGVVNLDLLVGAEGNLLSFCEFNQETTRFYVNVSIVGSNGLPIRKFSYGDSGIAWIKTLFESGADVSAIKKYELGSFSRGYDVIVSQGGKRESGKLIVGVLVSNED